MPIGIIRTFIGGALLIHGLGHGGALGALAWIGRFGEKDTGGWHAARSWLFPSLDPRTATATASLFWIASMIGFVAASLSFWGVLVPAEAWRYLAVIAFVSAIGILLFFGTWPTFNMLAALGMNIAVLIALLWLRWPPEPFGGR